MASGDERQLPFCSPYDDEDDGMYDAMASITTDDDVFEFRNTLCDIVSDSYVVKVDIDKLSKQGDKLMAAKRNEEAVKTFKAVLEAAPNNVVIGACLMELLPELGRIEEAAAIVLAQLRSSAYDEDLEKVVRFQLVRTYAQLGYAKKALEDARSATFDVESMKKTGKKGESKVSKDELIKGIQKLIDKTPQQKELNSEDFENALQRLVDPKVNENPSLCAFLFHHLHEHCKKDSSKDSKEAKIVKLGLFNDLNKVGALKQALLRPDFEKLSLMDCCMLLEFFDLANCSNEKIWKSNRIDLFSQEIFQSFLTKFAGGLVTNSSLKFLTHVGTGLHFDLIASWLQFVMDLAKKEPSFLNQSPFNQLNWHSRLIYANAVGFFGNDFEESVNMKRLLDRKTLAGYTDSCKLFKIALQQDLQVTSSITESLNLLDMILHLNFVSKQDLLVQPPMEKFIQMSMAGPIIDREGLSPKEFISLYETLLMKNRSLLLLCRRRPGLWVHLSQRLDFLAKNLDNLGGHGGPDLESILNLMVQMLECGNQDDEIDGFVEDDDFTRPVGKSLFKIMVAKIDEPTELLKNMRHLVIRIVVGLGRISEDVPKMLVEPGSKKDSGNIFASFLDMKNFDAISAEFFYILLKISPPLQVKAIENHREMPTFLAQLLSLIYESKERKREEIANVCLCLNRTILSKNPVLVSRDALIKSILFSSFEEPQKLIAKLAGFIRPTRRARRGKKAETETEKSIIEPSPIMPICAGLFLATLVQKDPVFRTALKDEDEIYGKVSDEFKKTLEKATQMFKL